MNKRKKSKINSLKKYLNFDKNIIREADIVLNDLVYDFENIKVEERDIGFLAIYAYPLLTELHSYYNNELCVSTAIINALMLNRQLDKKAFAYHFENCISRIISFWDYSMSLINEYLQLGFYTDTISRQEAIYYAGKRAVIGNEDGYNKLTYVDLEETEKKQKEQEAKKIAVVNRAKVIEKYKSDFYGTERFNMFFQLSETTEQNELRKIRNQIIHSTPVATNMTVKYTSLFNKNVISNTINGWIDYDTIIPIVQKGLLQIKEALILLTEIIKLDELPNCADTGEKEFYAYDVECSVCGFKDRLPEAMFGDTMDRLCINCWDNNLSIVKKVRSNEINNGSRLYNHLQKICSSDELI